MNIIFLLLLSSVTFSSVFTAKSSLSYVNDVAKVANCIQADKNFLKEVELYPKFTYTTKTPKEVAEEIRNMKPVKISTYRTKNPWSAAIATTYASDSETVYFNTRKNPRKLQYMVNTAFHEGLHLNNFSHGDNSPKGKEDSVNYRVGTISEKYVEKCK